MHGFIQALVRSSRVRITRQLNAEAMILAHVLLSYTRRQMFEIYLRMQPYFAFQRHCPLGLTDIKNNAPDLGICVLKMNFKLRKFALALLVSFHETLFHMIRIFLK